MKTDCLGIVASQPGESVIETVRRIEREALEIEHRELIKEVGFETAEEIRLARELGDLTYEFDEGELP
ncbi:MAG: hypothetical protein ABL959_09920 [Pyrinomonadaceae bacterium]